MGSQLGSDNLIGFAMMVPATAMIVTGHIWLGAAIVAAVVVAAVFSARSRIRAEAAQQQGYLSYAHTATSLGADPAPVIKAMRGSDEDGDDGPAVHLPPKRR
jgi:ABC-type methionine transport system permease subunit